MKTAVIRPGLLVSLRTTIKGGVSYSRIDKETERVTEDGELVARWETTKTIPDPKEYEAAIAARSKARAAVTSVCCPSVFGLLCPSDAAGKLDEAVTKARAIAAVHNGAAVLSQVEVFVLVGRVAADDAEAARAIGAEVRDLLEQMQTGIKAADPEMIRDAANKARAIGSMLSDNVSEKVSSAIEEARRAAREIVRRVEKSGEQAAAVVSELKMRAIESARMAFLDLDEEGKVTQAAPAPRSLDLDPDVSAAPRMEAQALPLEL